MAKLKKAGVHSIEGLRRDGLAELARKISISIKRLKKFVDQIE
ncbi:hypothetical protein [Thermococcus sp. LS1]|nr:hypothetical protein [Thermococcus sp. LS1]